jgi:NADH-quinone oxidoreductase subunit L
MGGLRKSLPGTFWTFLIGGASLAGLPLVTAGFYSKDWILWNAWASELGDPWLYGLGLFGAFLTAIYTFRLIFRVFFGEEKTHVHHPPGWRIMGPLWILAVLAIVSGFLETPDVLGHVSAFAHFLGTALPAAPLAHADHAMEAKLMGMAIVTSLAGLYIAYLLFLRQPQRVEALESAPWARALSRLWFSGWGFDRMYHVAFVAPVTWIAEVNKNDVVDQIYRLTAGVHRLAHQFLRATQTGQLRWYAASIGLGAAIIVAVVIFG